MMMKWTAFGVIVAAAMASSHTAYARCSEAGGAALVANALFAVYPNGTVMQLRWPASSPVVMTEGIRFLYVIDMPGETQQRTSGALAVRLVTTTANGPRRRVQSSHVRLKRDNVDTRRATRPHWTGRTRSQTYYNFHDPNQARSSDSYLRRDFHTDYLYVAGSPERSTYDQRARFHFPEMSRAGSGFFSQIFTLGEPNRYVEAPDKRYEAHIKYYRPRADERCVLIQPDLQDDDVGLNVTISHLDRERSRTWRIDWGPPVQ
jgi:hypothetical protein